MKTFNGKVAVVTGAARGIGRALVARCLRDGMKVVLADIDADALNEAATALETPESELLTVPTDVSRANDVAGLARKTVDRFGNVNLLFNNAGVGFGSSIWEGTLNDCKWVFEAIVQDRFYIFTHPEMHAIVKSRMEDIIQGRNPTPPTPPSPDRVNH